MIEAEYLAFELLTLMSARFGTSYVAAQSILSTGTTISYQLAFALSIASSTRVANFLGATMGDAAKISARTGFMAAIVVGIFNSCAMFSVRKQFARLYTADTEIISLVVHVMPLTAAFQLFDALACLGSGLLRGQGLLLCTLCITRLNILMVHVRTTTYRKLHQHRRVLRYCDAHIRDLRFHPWLEAYGIVVRCCGCPGIRLKFAVFHDP